MAIGVEKIDKEDLQLEITRLRKLLYLEAKYYDFDLQNPKIQSLSQKLDELIIIAIKEWH